MQDRGSDHCGVADRDDMASERRLACHPGRSALADLRDALTAMRRCMRIGHPDYQVLWLGGLKVIDCQACPPAIITVGKFCCRFGFERQRFGGLPGAQRRAAVHPIGAPQPGAEPFSFYNGLFFKRFVQRKAACAIGGGRAVADPGQARHHVFRLRKYAAGRNLHNA